MSTRSHRSSSTYISSSTSTSSYAMSNNGHSAPASPAPAIAALPSFSHSLSSFPSMTTVANGMVYYGSHHRTREMSEAKLHSALESTKQRRDARQTPHKQHPMPPRYDNGQPIEDEYALVIPRRKPKLPVQSTL